VSQARPSTRAKSPKPPSPAESAATIGYRDAIARALREAMAADPKVFVLGQDVGRFSIGGVTKGLIDDFGAARVRDCPISESAMVGIGAGAAMNGYTAVIEIAYADIAAVAFSSIVHSAAKLNYATNGQLRCPMVIRSPINRFSRHGPMGTEVTLSWFMNVPDLDIAMPASPAEAYWLLRHAFTRPVPTLFLEDRSLNGVTGALGPPPDSPGKARTLRAGRDAVVIAAGRMAVLALKAAEEIAADKRGDVGVLSLGAVKPLDAESILAAVRAAGRVLIVQEEPPFAGYGPAIQSLLDTLPLAALQRQPMLLARPDTFLPYNREEDVLPSAEKIAAALRALLA
jgi:acetoin:2,6-dichlorophenolindophenol oxidoreductase subunit beta